MRVAFNADNYVGESPIWSADDEALWWVNCEDPPAIHRWHPQSGAHRSWDMPGRVGGFVHKRGGNILVALADGLYDFEVTSETLTARVKPDLPPAVHLHECHCDRQGRFWIGAYDKDYKRDRSVKRANWYRLDGDQLTCVIEGVAVANGLAFSPDGTRAYFADAPSRRVDVYDLDPQTGDISNGRPFLQLKEDEGFVDGAAVDQDGGYWFANVTAGRLRRYLPDGTLDRIIELPFSNPTKPAFGGPDMRTLFITSTQLPLPAITPPTAPNGPVYAVDVDVAGIAETQLFNTTAPA